MCMFDEGKWEGKVETGKKMNAYRNMKLKKKQKKKRREKRRADALKERSTKREAPRDDVRLGESESRAIFCPWYSPHKTTRRAAVGSDNRRSKLHPSAKIEAVETSTLRPSERRD